MCISISPKYATSNVVDYLLFERQKRNFYCTKVSMVGLDEERVMDISAETKQKLMSNEIN